MAPKDDSPDGVNLSRRNFLKTTGVVGLVLSKRGVRLLQEGWEHLFLDHRREPVPRDFRRRSELHRAPVEPCRPDGCLGRDVSLVRPEGRAAGAGSGLLHPADKERAHGNHADLGITVENAFSGTSLGTKWSDPNKRSGFFGTFTY